MRVIIYTADDEEPKCNQCCYCNNDDLICADMCGPKYAWLGYERIEYEREN